MGFARSIRKQNQKTDDVERCDCCGKPLGVREDVALYRESGFVGVMLGLKSRTRAEVDRDIHRAVHSFGLCERMPKGARIGVRHRGDCTMARDPSALCECQPYVDIEHDAHDAATVRMK